MKTPFISINLEKLDHNLHSILQLCDKNQVLLSPVSKVIMGHPRITERYGSQIHSIGDSRIGDIHRMRSHGIKGPFMLIRTPAISEARAVVQLAEISMQSELGVLEQINHAALHLHQKHQIIVMVEMGDLREGIMKNDLEHFLKDASLMKGIEVLGIGTNATCFGGLIPTPDNLSFLEEAKTLFQSIFNRNPLISGGGSNLIPLMLQNNLPDCISHVRIGESIVMGVDAILGEPIPGTFQDCFSLYGEIIELKVKPSDISGPVAPNAFGEHPPARGKGLRKRALVNIGRLDTDFHHLKPKNEGIEILGASSDHLVIDIEEAGLLQVGDIIEFGLSYSSLLFTMNSPYVDKVFD